MTRVVEAWCAGRKRQVVVKDGPVNPLSVACPTCGQPRGRDCVNLNAGLYPKGGPYGDTIFHEGHASRRQRAELQRQAETS